MTRLAIYTLLLTLFFSVNIWAQREAHSIKIDPIAAVNPVKTQHTFIATVLDQNGNPMAGERVEWILARDPKKGVGDIVDHDGKGSIFGNTKIYKIANNYTVTFTSKSKRIVQKHTGNPKDDIQIGVGQTWCTITSPIEGETHVIAYCPAIKNHNKHKAFAIKYWIDAKLGWPKDAINRIGEPHTFTFTLRKASNNVPLPGYRIRWELQDSGPAAHLGGDKVKETVTDEEGSTSVTLKQKDKKFGKNVIKLELREANGRLLAVNQVVKTWISPALAIKKSGPAKGIRKETVTYSIVITNNGEAEARKVTVTDTLPQGFSYKSSSQKPKKVRGKKVTWNFGTLAKKGGSAKVSITVRADKDGTWTNTAQVSSEQGPGPKSSVVTRVDSPDLYIIKKGPKEVRLGDLATYTLTIKNRGKAVAKGVGIRDEVPQGMQYKNKKTGFALQWKIGNLNPGKSKTVRYRLKTVRTGTFTNIAKALLNRRKVHEAKWVTRVVAPDLAISKKGPPEIYLGKKATFNIVVKNNGTGTARNVVVTDTLPNKLEYISSTPPGVVKPATKTEPAIIIWKLGDIGPKKDVKIKLNTRGLLVGAATNTVKATSEGRSVDAKARVIIEGVPAVHINSYDTEDPVEVGKLTIYVIEIRNEGTSPCTNVVLKDDIPDEMEYVSASGPKEATAKGRRVTFAAVPILQPGEKVIYRIVCRAIKEGSAKNHGILTYKEFQKPIIDEEGTSIYK